MSFLNKRVEGAVHSKYSATIEELTFGWSDEDIEKLKNEDREAISALEDELYSPDHCVDSESYGLEIW